MNRNYTPKQIEKYKRQKYIAALEKCTKNLFRLFRDENSTIESYKNKFLQLKRELDKLEDIRLDTEYLRRTKEYIDTLFKQTVLNDYFTQKEYNDIKSCELTNLNRLQKMKNRTKYSKDKYKHKFF